MVAKVDDKKSILMFVFGCRAIIIFCLISFFKSAVVADF